MPRPGTPREALIEQIGEIDADIQRAQQQLVALRSRRWSLVVSLDAREDDTEELDPVTEEPLPEAPDPAWMRLMASEVGPARTGEHPVQQSALTMHRRSESYTPVKIHVDVIGDHLVPRTRKREINARADEPEPQVHLHYRAGRYDVALCGATATGDFGWWNTYSDDHDEVTLCLNCLIETESSR